MVGNQLYLAPGGIFPTIDDIRVGVSTDSNKGVYGRAEVNPNAADPDLVFSGMDGTPIPKTSDPKSSSGTA